MYKSETRREKANPLEKTQSKLQRKLNYVRKFNKDLSIKNMLRLEQNRRDHNFLDIIREYFPEAYTKAVKISKERYPNPKKLDELKKEMKEKQNG